MNKRSLEEYKEEFYKRFPDSEIKILEFSDRKGYILIKDKYGACQVNKKHLLKTHSISIQSALNKTEYFINQAKEIHGDKYDYSLVDYIKNNLKVKIICKEHGIFEQEPNSHLFKKGCIKCSKNNPVVWSYSNWEKAGQESKYFDSFKVYVLECWDENTGEKFYKIGKTFVKIERRFRNSRIPYKYKIVKIFKGQAKEISKLENKLQNKNKNFKYIPKKEFEGKHECFLKIFTIY